MKKKKVSTKRTLKKNVQNNIRKIRILKKKTVSRIAPRIKKRAAQTLAKKAVKKKPENVKPRTITAPIEKEVVEVSKFTAVAAPRETITQYNLPTRYYDNRIVLLVRDPWWLHTYWDISEEKVAHVVAQIPRNERSNISWIVRAYDVTGVAHFDGFNAHSSFDIGVNFDARNWYINVNAPGRAWCVDIGLLTPSGTFYLVARSNIITTPYFGISDQVDEEWALPDEEYFKILGIYDLGKSSLARRKQVEELVRRQISSGAFSGGISSMSSLREQKKARKFFLEVWTELILYGRTEATADVTVCGKKVKLREDGTFSLRYALPEGDFRFDVVATSEDKVDTLKKTPAVKRYNKK